MHKFANALFFREEYFPLTLTLSPIGERGKSGTDLVLMVNKPGDISYSLSPASEGRVGVRGAERPHAIF